MGSTLPSQDPVQLKMDYILDLRTVSGTWTAQAGKNAARVPIALSAVILQVSIHRFVFKHATSTVTCFYKNTWLHPRAHKKEPLISLSQWCMVKSSITEEGEKKVCHVQSTETLHLK